MTTALFTVHEDELVDMVAFLMDRKQIRHVLVEDDAHKLVGIVSYRSVLRLMADGFERAAQAAPAVKSTSCRSPTISSRRGSGAPPDPVLPERLARGAGRHLTWRLQAED